MGQNIFLYKIFQIYLVFVTAKKYIKHFSGSSQIEAWKSNGISEESIKNITRSDSNFTPNFVDHHLLLDTNFNGHCLIKNYISSLKKVINLYIFYTLGTQLRNLNTVYTLGNCLFGSVKLTTKNAVQINTSILATVLDLILVQNFYLQMEAMEKISLLLELI